MTYKTQDIALRRWMDSERDKPSDIATIVDKHKSIYSEEFGFPPEEFGDYVADGLLEFIQHRRGLLFIAEWYEEDYSDGGTDHSYKQEGVWAGCVVLFPDPVNRERARLRFLLVDPEFRGIGLGTALLNGALDFAYINGHKWITLSIAGDCGLAKRWFEKEGFNYVMTVPETTWGGVTEEWWAQMRRVHSSYS